MRRLIPNNHLSCPANVENEWMFGLVEVLLAMLALRRAASVEARKTDVEAVAIVLDLCQRSSLRITCARATYDRVETLRAILAIDGLVWARRTQT